MSCPHSKGEYKHAWWVHGQSCLTLCHPINCSPPGSLSMEFPRQECRENSELSFSICTGKCSSLWSPYMPPVASSLLPLLYILVAQLFKDLKTYFLLNFFILTIQFCVNCKVIQSYIHIYICIQFFTFSSLIGYCKILNRVLCSIQYNTSLLVIYSRLSI